MQPVAVSSKDLETDECLKYVKLEGIIKNTLLRATKVRAVVCTYVEADLLINYLYLISIPVIVLHRYLQFDACSYAVFSRFSVNWMFSFEQAWYAYVIEFFKKRN